MPIRKLHLDQLFKYLADSLRSRIIDKSDVSMANNLAVELSPSGRSLISFKDNKGPRIDPCGTPGLIGNQLDSWPFDNTF